MLITLCAVESPPAPFTVTVSADVMPVLPMSRPLPLVLLLVSVPPIVMLDPPPPTEEVGPVEAHSGRRR